MIFPVIMCGGFGSRLWPASSPARPKQFASLIGDLSSFQDAALRAASLAGSATPIIIAGRDHRRIIDEQLSNISIEAEMLLEPVGRDSAAAIAASVAWILKKDPEGLAVILSADHHVPDAEAFGAAIATAAVAARRGQIVTLGVRPTHPSSAYGYIRPGDGEAVRVVHEFVEKPDPQAAARYIAGGYLWNSGTFIAAAKVLRAELLAYAPAVLFAAEGAVTQAESIGSAFFLGAGFQAAPKQSIDYAVMEKTSVAAVLPVSFEWSDLGAWDAIWSASTQDDQGNVASGDTTLLDTSNTLVRARDVPVAVIGLSDIAVVAEGGAVLVCRLDQSQSVKFVVERRSARIPDNTFGTLAETRAWYSDWLRTNALPLWWTLGADHETGGFHEALTTWGEPWASPRRCRVQARQVFSYASAGAMGWAGPWRQAAWHGFDYLQSRYRRDDGLYRSLVGPDGSPLVEAASLYDQAFMLLALAELHRADPQRGACLAEEAISVRNALESMRHPNGGFRERLAHPFQSNAHMHLLEAAMAWEECGASEWRAFTDDLAHLALQRFVDPDIGVIREFFDADWRPAAGDEGRVIEPGHQFEWAWLLERWGLRRGMEEPRKVARRLFEIGVHGVEPTTGVVMNQLWDDLSIRDRHARLWPQTEYLKAALLLGTSTDVMRAASGLRRFLDTPTQGAWRDALDAEGRSVGDTAPASSFYHITCACRELLDGQFPERMAFEAKVA